MGTTFPGAITQGWSAKCVAETPHSLGKISFGKTVPCLWVTVVGVYPWIDCISVPSTCFNAFFLYIFNCRSSVLLIVGSFQRDFFSICSCVLNLSMGVVSFESWCSTILIPSLDTFFFLFIHPLVEEHVDIFQILVIVKNISERVLL